MKKVIVLLSAITIHLFCTGQSSVATGVIQQIHSNILHEERIYSISLPVSYHNKKYNPASYPVLYVLDGESSFEYTNVIVKFLSKGVYAHIPEMIVVGIHNTNRTKDLTPTKSSKKSPDDSTKILFSDSGGNDAYNDFLKRELIPHIDSIYRTNNFRVFVGHSFGGLAVTNTLLKYPELFSAYIIHDPSYWWDNEYMLKLAKQTLPLTNFKKKRVFISQAENEEKGAFDAHFEDIRLFKKILDSVNNTTLAFKYVFYENEDHGTIPLPATFDGLKFIFDGFWTDFKKTTFNKTHIQDSYISFSKKINYNFRPSQPMLDFIIKYFKEQNKEQEALAIQKLYHELYP